MRDILPLSDRFDLRYIRRRHFPGTWTRVVSVLAIVAVGGYVAAREWSGDRRMFTSGPLTSAHAIFADDCAQCHQPAADAASGGGAGGGGFFSRAGSRYWLPAQDAACLRCHVAATHQAHQSMFTGAGAHVPGASAPVVMSSDCRACHVEHRGADANLSAVADRTCTQCHADLNAFGRGGGR